MKICFLSSMHPPLDKRVFDKEAVSLAKQGFDVCHIAPDETPGNYIKNGIKIITYPRPKGIKGRIFKLNTLYRLGVGVDADIYHCNEVDSWFVGVCLKIFKKRGCVFDVHEHYPSTFAESRFPKWARPFVEASVRLVFNLLLPFTDYVVLAKKTVSSDFKCTSSKKILVRNFASIEAINRVDQSESLIKHKQNNNQLRLIHLGLISRLRGWPQIIEAMNIAKNKNIELLVIGKFIDGSFDDFSRSVSILGLSDRISYEPWMPYEEALKRVMLADVGLVMFQPGVKNHVFAMPHKMFDYMLARLAIILPSFAEEVAPIVNENECGMLIDSSNAYALAAALDYLVDNPDKRTQMGDNGYHAVIKHYNWESEAKNLISMYFSLEKQYKKTFSSLI